MESAAESAVLCPRTVQFLRIQGADGRNQSEILSGRMLAQTPGIGHGARRQGVTDGAVVEFFGNWVVGMQAGDVVPEFGGQAGGRSGVVRGDGHQVQGKRIVGGAVERAEIVPGVLIRRATVGGDFPAHRCREQAKVFRARKELLETNPSCGPTCSVSAGGKREGSRGSRRNSCRTARAFSCCPLTHRVTHSMER